jgi:hypothetical protein
MFFIILYQNLMEKEKNDVKTLENERKDEFWPANGVQSTRSLVLCVCVCTKMVYVIFERCIWNIRKFPLA